METHEILITALFATLIFVLFARRRHHGRRLPPSPWPRLPMIGHLHLLGPLLHHTMHRLGLKHGPLMSLHFGSVPVVVASSPHYAKQVLQINELSFIRRIETKAVKRLTYEASLAFAPYGDYYRFIKKLSMNELLGGRGINYYMPLRAQEYHGFLRYLGQKARAREPANVTENLLKLTNNVISRMMLGEVEEARQVVRDTAKIFGEFNISEFVWIFKKVDLQGFGKRIEDIFQRFDSLVEKIITKREQERKKKKMKNDNNDNEGRVRDFLDVLLDCGMDENCDVKVNRVHIKALIMDFFTAGTDTTAIATEWALVELLNNPKLLEKARKEIDDVVGNDRVVEEPDVPNLPFIQAIVKEIFRLHPPVPLVSRKCVTECVIENYVIPENTLTFINVWAIGRDPSLWESPLEFRPDRFLKPMDQTTGSSVDVRGQHFQLLPFGSGRRMCPGVTLAMVEVPALLAAIIQCFDFQVMGPDGKILKGPEARLDVAERPGLTVPRLHDLVVVPVARPIWETLKI